MNNQRLGNYPLVRLSLSVVLLIGLSAQVKADTLYGPLRAGETLSSIVNQNYLISPYEDSVIMREILRMNPQAFISNNMGLIRQGVMLTLPSDATLRRSQTQRRNNTQPIQSSPLTSSPAGVSEETLRQVRDERDQANLRIRRIESESSAQLATLNSRINRLETEKQTASEKLTVASAEIAELKQSVKDLEQKNSQLSASSGQTPVVVTTDNESSKKLQESSQVIAQQQQQISDLESSISVLNKETEDLKSSYQTAINDLESLKSKGANEVAQADIDATKKQYEAQIVSLTTEHQQALDRLNSSFTTELAEKDEAQTSLDAQIEELKADQVSKDSQITKLSTENNELNVALTAAKVSLEESAKQNVIVKEQAAGEIDVTGSTNAADANPLISAPFTKELFVQEIKKPVAFPLWGLLLGAFALGFTTLMMLFTRSRKTVTALAASDAATSSLEIAENSKQEKLVFHSGDPDAQDPDIETLRVPPRQDPSRVAIMDPTMVAAATVGITTNKIEPEITTSSTPTKDPALSDSQQLDSKLKLLIGETYEELGDLSAANEIFTEVQEEGNQSQKSEAATAITRLNS